MTSGFENKDPHHAKSMALMALAEGRLSKNGTRILDKHLRACAICQDELSYVRALAKATADTRAADENVEWETHDWSKVEARLLLEVEGAKTKPPLVLVNIPPPPKELSPSQARANRHWARPVLAVVAIAAAAALIFWQRSLSDDVQVAHDPAPVPHVEVPVFVAPVMDMRTTLVAGVVARESGNVPERVGMPIREGTRVRLQASARHDVAFASSESGALAVSVQGGAEGAAWSVATPNEHAFFRANLDSGKMTAKVDATKLASATPEHATWLQQSNLEVIALGHVLQSASGYFETQVSDGAIVVRVVAGSVRVTTPDGSVHEVVAPNSWNSAGAAVTAQGAPAAPLDFALASLRLALPNVVRWQIDDLAFDAPLVQLSHAPGTVRVRGWDARGQLFSAIIELREETELSADQLVAERPREMQGTIPPEQIAAVVRASLPRLRRCYELGLRQRPELSGNLTAEVTVDLEGRVSGLEFADGETSSALVSCVRAEASRWSFPPPAGGRVRFALPLRFEAER